MAWLSKLAGHVDRLGYVWCVGCKDVPERVHPADKVFADTFPTCEDPCEGCAKVLADAVGREKVQESSPWD